MPDNNDRQWMNRALRLARRGWGRTTPNPMVGAVVVRDGEAAGYGYHARAGTDHAEPAAIKDAEGATQGATLYVTLEPCCTHGRTPPCTDAIIRAGISRVVVGCLDPNPNHAGRGVDVLRSAGVQVDVGVRRNACEELNEAFFHWIRHKRPFVLLKMAMTLDGKIATASGQSQWITGPAARRHVQKLRQWCDAIMVGGETVRQDNPSLTVRTPQNWWRQPRKLIWTRQTDLDRDLNIWRDPGNPPRIVAPRTSAQWSDMLDSLGAEEITALLLEGGGELAGAALQAGIVDKVAFFIAPKILAGRGSRPVVGGSNPDSLAEALPLTNVQHLRIGDDLLVTGYVSKASE